MNPFKPGLNPKIIATNFFTLLAIFVLFPVHSGFAGPRPEALESKVKKVAMMLNIVAREYALAVEGGKVINEVEYDESQVFLSQAKERVASLASSAKSRENAGRLDQSFNEISGQVLDKRDPNEIRIALKGLQTRILKEFDIEFRPAPTRPVSLDNGRRIYRANCRICHGSEGRADGPLASQLDPKPAVLADPEITGDQQSNAHDNFEVINVGIANTAMVGWADILAEEDIWDVTYYVRTFSNVNVKLPVVAAKAIDSPPSGKDLDRIFGEIQGLLERSLSAFREQQEKEAGELAFEAYLAYEKVEAALSGKNKPLGTRLESSFSRLRGEIKRNAPAAQIESVAKDLSAGLEEGLAVMKEEIGATGLFMQSFAIIVREGFEAILILAALIAFLVKSRNAHQVKTIYLGAGTGIGASLVTAYIFNEFIQISTANQEVMEGVIMLVAVVLLFYISFWLISKIGAQKFQRYVNVKLREALSTGSAFTLGMLAFLSVYREGFETVLFYQALYTYAGPSSAGIVPGFFAGCVCLGLVFYLINKLGVRIPVRWFFAVTGIFLYYMAFTFMGKGLHALQVGGSLSLTQIDFIPQITWMGMYATMETFIGQGALVAAYVIGLIYTFGIKREAESRELQQETSQLQNKIAAVHELVGHISGHARRCEVFLKDTRDEDLKELSGHLREIHDRVHELSDQVHSVEDHLVDEHDRLVRQITAEEEKRLH